MENNNKHVYAIYIPICIHYIYTYIYVSLTERGLCRVGKERVPGA